MANPDRTEVNMSKPNQQSSASQVPSEEKSAPSRGLSQTRRPTIRQQQDALFSNALKLVDQQFQASRVIGEVETLRAENAKLRERNRILGTAFAPFTARTDSTPCAIGLLGFVSHQLQVQGWANDPDSDGSGDCLVEMLSGHEAVRHFRFLAALVDLAAVWVADDTAEAAKDAGK